MTTKEATFDKIELEFNEKRDTKNTRLFEEVLGEQEYSDKGFAIGSLYVQIQALELMGNPKKLKVTIEHIK